MREKLVDYYIERSLEDNFEIDQIRKELELKNIDNEEIKVIVRLVDNEVQKRALNRSSNQKFNEMMYIGIVLMVVGVGLTLGTYTGIINMGNSFLIAYGPFFAGASLFITGLVRNNRGGGKMSSGRKF